MLPATARNAVANEFVAAARAYAAGTIDTAEMRRQAMAALSCAEGLREEECDVLGVPHGSSVDHAAQKTLDDLADTAATDKANVSAIEALEKAQAVVDKVLADVDVSDEEKARRKSALTEIPEDVNAPTPMP